MSYPTREPLATAPLLEPGCNFVTTGNNRMKQNGWCASFQAQTLRNRQFLLPIPWNAGSWDQLPHCEEAREPTRREHVEKPYVCYLTDSPSELPVNSLHPFQTREWKSFQKVPAIKSPSAFKPSQVRGCISWQGDKLSPLCPFCILSPLDLWA